MFREILSSGRMSNEFFFLAPWQKFRKFIVDIFFCNFENLLFQAFFVGFRDLQRTVMLQ